MAVGKDDRGQFWVDGQFTVRLRGLGSEPGRILRIRRPFAVIGRCSDADIRIEDALVDDRHAVLLLDGRGIFGVDLLSRSGTRFAGAQATSAWLGAGDILEVAGRRIELLQLRIDGQALDTVLSDDDPLGDSPDLVPLSLRPMEASGPPWMLGSALAFLGRGEACAIRIADASVEVAHCALLRDGSSAHVIDLVGHRTRVNGWAVAGASEIADGDVLTVGEVRFLVGLGSSMPDAIAETSTFDKFTTDDYSVHDETKDLTLVVREPDRVVGLNPQGAMVAMLLEAVAGGRDAMSSEVLSVLRQFQADSATLFEAQIERIEAMNREIARLREEIRGHLGPPPEPAEPLKLDLVPPPSAPSAAPAGWLLDRLNTLETESRSSWKDLLGRITATVASKQSPQTSQSLDSNHPEVVRPRRS